jgi:hypothetical protein
MTGPTRIAALRYALIATGVIFIVGIYTPAQIWPTGWTWGVGHSHFWPMILGALLLVAALLAFP